MSYIYADFCVQKLNVVENMLDGIKIRVNPDIFKKLAEELREDEEICMILIACIEHARLDNHPHRKQKSEKISGEQILQVIPILYKEHHMERLITVFDGMKHHEILEVFEAKDVLRAFNEYV